MRTALKRFVAAPAIVGVFLMLGGAAFAAKTVEECSEDLGVCNKGCNGPAGDLGDWCYKECEKTFMDCGPYGGGGKKLESGPDPIFPRTGDSVRPAGGISTAP